MEKPDRGWECDGGEHSQREKHVEEGRLMEGEREGHQGWVTGNRDG